MSLLVLIKPKLLSLKNRVRGNYKLRAQFGRDIVLVLFSIGVLIAIFNGTQAAIDSIQSHANIAYLPPTLPLSMLLLMLFVMLILSNSVAVVGSFYQSSDLDMVLASPVSPAQFFWGKFIDVIFGSSWMAFVFALPAIVAFGNSYQAGWLYYCVAIATFVPYFVIPSALTAFFITFIAKFVSINRTREVMLCVALLITAILYMLGRLMGPGQTNLQDVNEVLKLLSVLSFPQTKWLPSYWVGVILGEFLQPSGRMIWPYVTMLFGCATASIACAYIVVRYFHLAAFTITRSGGNGVRLKSKQAQRNLRWLTPFIYPQYRALLGKEIKTFSRDIAQAIQLMLLLGLCMIYLYNFRVLHAVQGLPPNTKAYWQGFLVFSNVGMGAFVITAVCSRFVFPSVSLEGQSYWILQTAPITSYDVLRAKFWCWLIPVAGISSVIFASGAIAIDAPWQIVVVNAMTSWIICYGVVGLAVGMGALFANFDWENSSQLAASFGSLIFMIASSILICISLLPVAILIFLRTLRNFGYVIPEPQWYICIASSAFLLAYANYFAMRWAITAGENALFARTK